MTIMQFIRGITPGDWAKVVVMIFVAGTIYATRSADIASLRRDVDRHEALLKQIDDTQRIALQTLAVCQQRLADHLETAK